MSQPTPRVIEIHPGLQLKGRLSMDNDVVLTGKFEGELQTYGCLTVASGGEVTGAIEVGSLILEPGNRVEAKVSVGLRTRPVVPERGKTSAPGWFATRFEKFRKFAFGRK